MSKATKSMRTYLNVKIHRIYGKIQSSIMSFRISKGFFVSAGIGLLSVAKIIVQGYWTDEVH